MAFSETPTKGFVMKFGPYSPTMGLTDEEVAAYNRALTRKALRNILIFAGMKVAILYGINRLSRHAYENK